MRKSHRKNSLLVLFGILVLFSIVIYCGIQLLDSAVFAGKANGEPADSHSRKTVTVDGVDYFPKQDITVVLAMGIDEEGKAQSSGSYNNRGEADVIALLVFDETAKDLTVFSINRDTMVNMPVLGVGGKRAGERYGQIALSHTYGDGLAESCENTRETVENLINGLTIDYYISANMDAIGLVNDAVGGVTVNVTDDFSDADVYIPMGQVTLQGDQAESFVRLRKGLGDQLNSSRMNRQAEYIRGFIDAVDAKSEESDTFAYSVYEELSGYIVTDMSLNVFSGMADRYADFELNEIITPQGENRLGEKYNEFYLDEAAFDKMVLEVFYAPKDNIG